MKKVLVTLITDPRRFGNSLYFNPDVLGFRLGTDPWTALEALVSLEDAGILKLHAPPEFGLLYQAELMKVRVANFLGLKGYNEIASDFKRVWLLGRVLKLEVPQHLGLHLTDHVHRLSALSTNLTKMLRLFESKSLVSKEVYMKVAASVMRETAVAAKEAKEILLELSELVRTTSQLIAKLRETRASIEETTAKLGIKLEENEILVKAYRAAENELLGLLALIKTKLLEVFPNWNQILASYDKLRSEFAVTGQDFIAALETMKSINDRFVVVKQAG
jgi:hypothetical protein